MWAADVNLIMPHVPHIITFVEQIAADPEHSDAVVGATCGLIGFVLLLCSDHSPLINGFVSNGNVK